MKRFESLGQRIRLDHARVDPALVARAGKLPTSILGDVVQRLQALPAGFTAFGGRKAFAGPALTVRVRPGDNLFLHKALDVAQPGDVVVVDAGGALQTAIIGALMSRYARSRGIVAVVLDGAIRDVDELARLDIAVVARGATPNGPFKSGPGEIGCPIGCGGLSVAAGDLIVGDADGVLVLPQDQVAGLLDAAEHKHRTEQIWEREIEEGRWDRSWVDQALERL